jgi:hypothetical protein
MKILFTRRTIPANPVDFVKISKSANPAVSGKIISQISG